jgi:hypothetical protein
MGAYAVGAISQIGKDVKEKRDQRNADKAESSKELRDKKADEIEDAIKNIQAKASLPPGSPGAVSPEEAKAQIKAAHEQLSGLYEPHEAPQLLDRVKKIFQKKQPAAAAGGAGGGPQLKPGMTLEDVLQAGGPVPKQPTAGKPVGKPFRDDSGKWFQMEENDEGNFIKKPMPGYTEENELQRLMRQGYTEEEAKKIMRIEGGLEAGATKTKKGFKYDAATDEVVDQDTQERFSRQDDEEGLGGETVHRMFQGTTAVKKEKKEEQATKFQQSLDRQVHAFELAIQRGDHAAAKRIVNTAKADLLSARDRMETMDKNKKDALAGNQQAMLSLVANHIGMTLGAQKGARITRAVWDEAMESAPWLDVKIGKFFHTDANGDKVFDGWKTGVTLTPEQINQMVDLGHQRVDSLEDHVKHTEEAFAEDLGKSNKGKTDKPATEELTPEEKAIQEKLKSMGPGAKAN